MGIYIPKNPSRDIDSMAAWMSLFITFNKFFFKRKFYINQARMISVSEFDLFDDDKSTDSFFVPQSQPFVVGQRAETPKVNTLTHAPEQQVNGQNIGDVLRKSFFDNGDSDDDDFNGFSLEPPQQNFKPSSPEEQNLSNDANQEDLSDQDDNEIIEDDNEEEYNTQEENSTYVENVPVEFEQTYSEDLDTVQMHEKPQHIPETQLFVPEQPSTSCAPLTSYSNFEQNNASKFVSQRGQMRSERLRRILDKIEEFKNLRNGIVESDISNDQNEFLENLKLRISQLESENQTIKKEHVEARSEVTSLKRELNNIKSEHEELRNEHEGISRKYQNLLNDYNNLKNETNSEEQCVNQLSDETNRLNEEIACLKEENLELKSTINHSTEHNISSEAFQNEILRLKEENERLTKEISSLKNIQTSLSESIVPIMPPPRSISKMLSRSNAPSTVSTPIKHDNNLSKLFDDSELKPENSNVQESIPYDLDSPTFVQVNPTNDFDDFEKTINSDTPEPNQDTFNQPESLDQLENTELSQDTNQNIDEENLHEIPIENDSGYIQEDDLEDLPSDFDNQDELNYDKEVTHGEDYQSSETLNPNITLENNTNDNTETNSEEQQTNNEKSGFFTSIGKLFTRSSPSNSKEMKLGNKVKDLLYYNEDLKRWVERGKEHLIVEEKATPPPKAKSKKKSLDQVKETPKTVHPLLKPHTPNTFVSPMSKNPTNVLLNPPTPNPFNPSNTQPSEIQSTTQPNPTPVDISNNNVTMPVSEFTPVNSPLPSGNQPTLHPTLNPDQDVVTMQSPFSFQPKKNNPPPSSGKKKSRFANGTRGRRYVDPNGEVISNL